jgi:hypothetical protein
VIWICEKQEATRVWGTSPDAMGIGLVSSAWPPILGEVRPSRSTRARLRPSTSIQDVPPYSPLSARRLAHSSGICAWSSEA